MSVHNKTAADVQIQNTNIKKEARISRFSREGEHVIQDPNPSSKTLGQRVSLGRESEASEPLRALSSREREILTRVARGLSNQDIAEELGVSPFTIRCTLHHASVKLEARSRLEAVYIAVIRGYICLDEILGVDELIVIFSTLSSQVLREAVKRLKQRRFDELVDLVAPFEPTMLQRAARHLKQRHEHVQLPPVAAKAISNLSSISAPSLRE